jgi:hypothetical protein
LDFQQGQGQHRFPSGHYDIAMWDQGLRHGPATYFHPNGGKEEATYIEGYENGPSTVYFARFILSHCAESFIMLKHRRPFQKVSMKYNVRIS